MAAQPGLGQQRSFQRDVDRVGDQRLGGQGIQLVAKLLAEVLVFVFNFLFLRDFVFGRTNDAASD